MTEGVFYYVFGEVLHGYFFEAERRLMGETPK